MSESGNGYDMAWHYTARMGHLLGNPWKVDAVLNGQVYTVSQSQLFNITFSYYLPALPHTLIRL